MIIPKNSAPIMINKHDIVIKSKQLYWEHSIFEEAKQKIEEHDHFIVIVVSI